MKKILVLIKLSQNTSNLTRAAAMLAARLHLDILLFNCYPAIYVSPFYGDSQRISQIFENKEHESKDVLDKMATDLQQFITRSFPEENALPVVSHSCEQGGLEDNVKYITEHEDIELVIMGSSGEGSLMRLFTGTNTRSFIDHINRPILVIPYGIELKDISKVVFATDYAMSDIKAVNYFSTWANAFHAEFDVVHVDVFGDKQSSEMVEREIFLDMLEDINHPNLKHKLVHGKELLQSLNRFCSQENADLLGLLHHQDSFIRRMFTESTAGDFLEKHTIPVIIFPSEMV